MEKNEEPDTNLAFEKLKLKIDLIKWFTVSVAVTLITFFFNWGLQERNQGIAEIKQYETHVELITNVDNIAKRRLLAQFFSTVTASEKLRKGWQAYYEIVNKEYNNYIDSLKESKSQQDTSTTQGQIKSQQIQNAIEELNSINIKSPIVTKASPDRQIIYFQITNQSLRSFSDSLVLRLNNLGFNAYGTEFVALNLDHNRIIYYREEDLSLAIAIKQKLESIGLETELKFFKQLSNKAKPGTIEVWIREKPKRKKGFDSTFDDTF